MDASPIYTYEDILPFADDSSKENETPEQPKNNKRKRQDDEVANPFFRHFTASIHSRHTIKSTFVPIAHLPRADLPLIWLHNGSGVRAGKMRIPSGALVDAVLEQVHNDALQDKSTLVARLLPNGGLYVFEKACHQYLIWALQPWLSENRVISQSLGTKLSEEDDVQNLLKCHDAQVPARPLPSGYAGSPKKPKDRRGAIARKVLLPAPENVSTMESLSRPTSRAADRPLEVPIKTPTKTPPKTPIKPLVEATMLDVDMLRVNYLETLYLSKTSLAYFAKGPLARARNAPDMHEKLLNFYRESIISMKKLDLKYKESVNKVIESLSNSKQPDETTEKPLKNNRKKKIGKDALYANEEDYIRKSWLEREIPHSKPLSTQSQFPEQRNHVSELRTRETKMQILLILEVLTLEALPSTVQEPTSSSGTAVKTDEQVEKNPTALARTPSKIKAKSKTYISDLETLVDRLCIWHTVGVDDLLYLSEKKDDESRSSSNKQDQLVDFCAEAIVPFYASRLQEDCQMICKKLGGPKVSPKRSKTTLTKSASTSQLAPGAAIHRRPQAVSKKTLERVLSDDRSMRHASPPTLTRSATAPLVSNLKKETSETYPRPASRGALYKSVSFSNREVDLHADARVQEAKRRRLARVAEQKKELDAAIVALKKPNRSVAAQGLMDEMERRTMDNGSRKQSAHITATPRRSKSSATHDLHPADVQVVPSSTVRPTSSSTQWNPPESTTKKRATLFAIHETPVRKTAVEDAFRDAPVIPVCAGKAMDRVMGTEMSVYDALGWNDDYDL